MNRKRLLVFVGCGILLFWAIFYLYIFQDWYLTKPSMGFIIDVMAPIALIVNVVGVIFGCRIVRKEPRQGTIVLVLYGTPLLMATWFFWWLFFGVKI